MDRRCPVARGVCWMNYSANFETWWKFFCLTSPSKKGSKYEAYGEWCVLKKNNELPDIQELIDGVQKHANNDAYYKAKGEFVASWKHGCRWLRNREWEVVDEGEIERNRKIESRQRRVEADRQKYRDEYSGVFSEWTQERYDNHVARYGNQLDWLWHEVKGQDNE